MPRQLYAQERWSWNGSSHSLRFGERQDRPAFPARLPGRAGFRQLGRTNLQCIGRSDWPRIERKYDSKDRRRNIRINVSISQWLDTIGFNQNVRERPERRFDQSETRLIGSRPVHSSSSVPKTCAAQKRLVNHVKFVEYCNSGARRAAAGHRVSRDTADAFSPSVFHRQILSQRSSS